MYFVEKEVWVMRFYYELFKKTAKKGNMGSGNKKTKKKRKLEHKIWWR